MPLKEGLDLGDLLAARRARMARHRGGDDLVNEGAVVQDPRRASPEVDDRDRIDATGHPAESRAEQRHGIRGRVAPWARLEWPAVVVVRVGLAGDRRPCRTRR